MVDAVEVMNDMPAIEEGTVVVGTAATPMGAFGAVFTARGLACLSFTGDSLKGCEVWVRRWMPEARVARAHPALDRLSAQLSAYLAGTLQEFTVPVDLRGTEFQMEVWRALQEIPYGDVRSYAEIAESIGRPKAVRAVGMANHDNPVPIVVPCHRVIGSNRTLTGYGGGLDLKEKLLQLEGVLLAEARA